jgi:tetratricopeptide (TPR) repeat protein
VNAARAGLVAVAVLVLGWLAVMERDLRLQRDGVAALRPGASPARLAGAERDLERARLLNPDPAPDVSLALLYRARGEEARALAAIEDVVRREPDNLTAWATLGLLGRDDDALRARFEAALRRIDPVNAR